MMWLIALSILVAAVTSAFVLFGLWAGLLALVLVIIAPVVLALTLFHIILIALSMDGAG